MSNRAIARLRVSSSRRHHNAQTATAAQTQCYSGRFKGPLICFTSRPTSPARAAQLQPPHAGCQEVRRCWQPRATSVAERIRGGIPARCGVEPPPRPDSRRREHPSVARRTRRQCADVSIGKVNRRNAASAVLEDFANQGEVWAYAGVTFAWGTAFVSASASGEPMQIRIMPLVLLALLIVSYVTRASSRRVYIARANGPQPLRNAIPKRILMPFQRRNALPHRS
jgi:hypothetical protein